DAGGGGNPDLAMAVPDLTQPPDLTPVHSGIGDACMGANFNQGTCNDGQICIPDGTGGTFMGGYCTEQCDAQNPCPSDAKCVPFGGQSFCFADCTTDGDCRMGYHGSTNSHTCR